MVVIDTIDGSASDTISDTSRLPFAVLPVSLPVSDLESLASESFFSDFAYVRVVSSLFEAASTVVAPLHPASLFTPSKLPAASPPASTAHKLNVRPFFAIFLILSFLLSLFIIIKSLHESMSFIYVIYLSLFPFDASKYRNDLCSLCGKNVFNL